LKSQLSLEHKELDKTTNIQVLCAHSMLPSGDLKCINPFLNVYP